MKEVIMEQKNIHLIIVIVTMLIFGLLSLFFGLGLFLFHGQPIYFQIAKLLISSAGLIYIIASIFIFRLKTMLIFGLLSLFFGLGLFSPEVMNRYIYNGYFILLFGYSIIASIFIFRLGMGTAHRSFIFTIYTIPFVLYYFSQLSQSGGALKNPIEIQDHL